MHTKIFLCYRRDDAEHATRLVYQTLSTAFQPDHVFYDRESIRPTEDFTKAIDAALQSCVVLVALIGPRWLTAEDAKTGERRIDDPSDLVRHEIATALARPVPVMPCLIGGAQMPGESDLPAPLRRMATINALPLSNERFDRDLSDGVHTLHWRLAEAEEAERRAQQSIRRLHDPNEPAAPAGRAGRSGHWLDFVPTKAERALADVFETSDDPADFRRYLEKFPTGSYADLARRRLDDIAWREALYSRDRRRLSEYIDQNPDGQHADRAAALLQKLERRRQSERPSDRPGRPPRSKPA